jgi:hypothetical protein
MTFDGLIISSANFNHFAAISSWAARAPGSANVGKIARQRVA